MASAKFKALTHFMIHECADNPKKLGATRLNKSLWYADILAYRATGASITGDKYVKRQNGPVPAEILSTIRELQADGMVAVKEPEAKYEPRQFFSLKHPDTDSLSADEMSMARAVLSDVCNLTTTEVSEATHTSIWAAAAMGEEIPLEATLVGRGGEITEEVANWAISVVDSEKQLEVA